MNYDQVMGKSQGCSNSGNHYSQIYRIRTRKTWNSLKKRQKL